MEKFLYHYTDCRGFSGIFSDGFFRAKNNLLQKDFMEVSYPFCLLKKALNECLKDQKEIPEEKKSFYCARLTQKLDKLINSFDRTECKNPLYPICSISFSEERDSDNQWENYGHYCFEFDKDKIEDLIVIQYIDGKKEKGKLKKCIYDYDMQIAGLKKIVFDVFDFESIKYAPEFNKDFAEKFIELAPLIKKSDFALEREHRLIFKISSDLVNRIGNTSYYEAFVDFKNCLKGVRLYPEATQEDYEFVFCCLKRAGLEEFANYEFVTKCGALS